MQSRTIRPSVPVSALDIAAAFRASIVSRNEAARPHSASTVEEWRQDLAAISGHTPTGTAMSSTTVGLDTPPKPYMTVGHSLSVPSSESGETTDTEAIVIMDNGADDHTEGSIKSGSGDSDVDCWEVSSLVSSPHSFVFLDRDRAATQGVKVEELEGEGLVEESGEILEAFIDVVGDGHAGDARGLLEQEITEEVDEGGNLSTIPDEEAMLRDVITHVSMWYGAPKKGRPKRYLRVWMQDIQRVRDRMCAR